MHTSHSILPANRHRHMYIDLFAMLSSCIFGVDLHVIIAHVTAPGYPFAWAFTDGYINEHLRSRHNEREYTSQWLNYGHSAAHLTVPCSAVTFFKYRLAAPASKLLRLPLVHQQEVAQLDTHSALVVANTSVPTGPQESVQTLLYYIQHNLRHNTDTVPSCTSDAAPVGVVAKHSSLDEAGTSNGAGNSIRLGLGCSTAGGDFDQAGCSFSIPGNRFCKPLVAQDRLSAALSKQRLQGTAHTCSRAVSAASNAAASGLSSSDIFALPAAPLANPRTVSFVLVSPSTVICVTALSTSAYAHSGASQ